MGKFDSLNPEERKAAEAHLRQVADEAQKGLAELGVAAPATTGSSKEVTGDEVDQLADRFWRMTQKERHDNLEKDPEGHKRLLEAVEQQGTRKLMKLGRPS